MNTRPVTAETLAASVIAVPPLARNTDLTLSRPANQAVIRHLEAGGATTLLYGGNAVLYHVAPSEYGGLLDMLEELAGERTLVIPSAGPAYGTLLDQARLLRDRSFPTTMVLPQREVTTSAGVATGVRHFVEACGRPAVLYIKHDGWIDVAAVRKLMDDQLLSWIKYAVVRDHPADDRYLRELVDAVGSERIVSGIGEQPAVVHMRQFGLQSFTSGCVCIAPRLSMRMLAALRSGAEGPAERIRETFRPLEELRNSIHPIRVLHAAVRLAGIADTGPLLPLLSDVDLADEGPIRAAASRLLAAETAAHSD